MQHNCSIAAPLDVDWLLVQVYVDVFLYEGQLDHLEFGGFETIRGDRGSDDDSVGEGVGGSGRLFLAFLLLVLGHHIRGVILEERLGSEVGDVFVVGTESGDVFDSLDVGQFGLDHVAVLLLVIEDSFSFVFNDLDYSSSGVAQVQLYLFGDDGAGGENAPVVVLLVAFLELGLRAHELNQSGLERIADEEIPAEGGLNRKAVVKDFATHQQLALSEADHA